MPESDETSLYLEDRKRLKQKNKKRKKENMLTNKL